MGNLHRAERAARAGRSSTCEVAVPDDQTDYAPASGGVKPFRKVADGRIGRCLVEHVGMRTRYLPNVAVPGW
jgi:hypothetical protein